MTYAKNDPPQFRLLDFSMLCQTLFQMADRHAVSLHVLSTSEDILTRLELTPVDNEIQCEMLTLP
jgi:hypothetical protein